jgi:hypothetical protein
MHKQDLIYNWKADYYADGSHSLIDENVEFDFNI